MIEIDVGHYWIKILIDGMPHVCMRADQFQGFSSWIDPEHWCIEFALNGGSSIVTEYDDIKTWADILALLNEHLA